MLTRGFFSTHATHPASSMSAADSIASGKENVFGWQNFPVLRSLPLHITKPEVISSKLGTSRLKGWNLFFTVPYDM